MYKHGRPLRIHHLKALLVITAVIFAIAGGIYFLVIKSASTKTVIKNSGAFNTKIAATNQSSITINEPLFTLDLPGHWRETARDNDPHYQSIQWNDVSKNAAGRWVRVYTDSIPDNFALNFLQPVISKGNALGIGQMSDNCVTFTQGATPNADRDVSVPASQATLPARWQGVSFLCDNSHVSHQVVGTGSAEGNNQVTLNGPEHGQHKFFLVYEDDSYHADYSIFTDVLTSFRAK
jgi:hypothetical protein